MLSAVASRGAIPQVTTEFRCVRRLTEVRVKPAHSPITSCDNAAATKSGMTTMNTSRISAAAALLLVAVSTSAPANAMSMVEYALRLQAVKNTPQGQAIEINRRAREMGETGSTA